MFHINRLAGLPPQVWGASSVLAATGVGALIACLIIWSLVWKGLALWRAARNGATIWFIVLLVVNTIGILDIIYYYYVHKKKWGKK